MSISSNPSSSIGSSLAGERLRSPVVLWIHQTAYTDGVVGRATAEDLHQQMRQQGIEVRSSTLQALTVQSLDGVDMVLIDAFDDFDSIVQMSAVQVRILSRVPLVLLTHTYSSEQLVLALRSGIDAILSCQTQPDLLMARCNAILRRWRANGVTRNKT